MKTDIKLSKIDVLMMIKKIAICAISVIILGISVALNTRTDLGTDPISVFYNGISEFTGLKLGLATNCINATLALIVFMIDRKYINLGTIIYVLLLGPSISVGLNIYDYFNPPNNFTVMFIISLLGCLLAFLGLGSFIAIDMGIDPWSASTIIISKKLNKPFGAVMVVQHVSVLIVGYLLGGVVGIITLFTAVAGGPCIQKVSEFLDKIFVKMLKSKE